jgi:hypothetical protein
MIERTYFYSVIFIIIVKALTDKEVTAVIVCLSGFTSVVET